MGDSEHIFDIARVIEQCPLASLFSLIKIRFYNGDEEWVNSWEIVKLPWEYWASGGTNAGNYLAMEAY